MPAIDLTLVQNVKNQIERDLKEDIAIVNHAVFAEMHAVVHTDIENANTKYLFKRKRGTATSYVQEKELSSTIGKVVPRELKVAPVFNFVPDNVQNYREKEPLSMAGVSSGGPLNAPHIEFNLRQIATTFGEDIYCALFFSKRDTAKTTTWDAYDGWLKHITDDIADGTISVANKNLIAMSPIAAATTVADKVANFDNVVTAYNQLDPRLRRLPLLLCYCTVETHRLICEGYLLKYQSLQKETVYNPEFRFVGLKNVQFVPLDIMGEGDVLIFTEPDNFEYGADLTSNGEANSAFIDLAQSYNDANVIRYQIQVACGTRVLDVLSRAFAITTGTLTPTPFEDEDVSGYAVTISASSDDGGSGEGGGGGETTYTYTPVGSEALAEAGANPKTNGWYESDGNGGYVLTNDETVTAQKAYYIRS